MRKVTTNIQCQISPEIASIRCKYEVANPVFIAAAIMCLDRAPDSLRRECLTEAIVQLGQTPSDIPSRMTCSLP